MNPDYLATLYAVQNAKQRRVRPTARNLLTICAGKCLTRRFDLQKFAQGPLRGLTREGYLVKTHEGKDVLYSLTPKGVAVTQGN